VPKVPGKEVLCYQASMATSRFGELQIGQFVVFFYKVLIGIDREVRNFDAPAFRPSKLKTLHPNCNTIIIYQTHSPLLA
jgi:hypothetical protein